MALRERDTAATGAVGVHNAAVMDVDIAVIGAGIIGLATAHALVSSAPSTRICIIDKESRFAAHQSGHNSGVLHSGIYYRPGSSKAQLCVTGRAEMVAWCRDHGVDHEVCGKVIVATDRHELEALGGLKARGAANGVEATLVDRTGLAELEPHVEGLGALHIAATGVVDFVAVCRSLVDELVAAGVTFLFDAPVGFIREDSSRITIGTGPKIINARRLVNCAGLHCDRIAALAGVEPSVAIIPFRGEYHELVGRSTALVRHLVYPVPDPRFPFLGVHFTKGIDGKVHVGPNAVLALAREGYLWRHIDARDLADMARFPGFRRMARRYAVTGAHELRRAVNRRALIADARRLVPDIAGEDLVRSTAGVRAQAVDMEGNLVDDFVIMKTGMSVHVLNAPSPAATASLAIGRRIAADLTTG